MSVFSSLLLTAGGLTALGLGAAAVKTRKLARIGEQIVPQAGKLIDVDGGRIHYVEAGDPQNPTLVMIHGLSGQLQHFTYALTDRLAQDFHVVAIDRPGCGYSTRNSASHATLPEQARMIGECLDRLDIADPILVGHSLGGAVSLAMALDRPDRTAALALISPLTHHIEKAPDVFRPLELRTAALRNLIGHTIAVPLAQWSAEKTLTMVFDPEPCPADFIDRAGAALGLRPEAFITASEDMVGAEATIGAQAARYSELTLPGAVLFGAEDAILSPSTHGLSMEPFGHACEQVSGGHMLPITAPDACETFIRGVSAMVPGTS